MLYLVHQSGDNWEWVVGTSSQGLQCGSAYCCNGCDSDDPYYLRSSYSTGIGPLGIGPPTLAAYNNGPSVLGHRPSGGDWVHYDGWVEYIRTPEYSLSDGRGLRVDRCEFSSDIAIVAGVVSPKQQLQSYHVLE